MSDGIDTLEAEQIPVWKQPDLVKDRSSQPIANPYIKPTHDERKIAELSRLNRNRRVEKSK